MLGGGYLQNSNHAFPGQTEKEWNWKSRSKKLILVSNYMEQQGSFENEEKLAIGMQLGVAKNVTVSPAA